MTNLLRSLTRSDWPTLSFEDWLAQLNNGGWLQGFPGLSQTLNGTHEEIEATFVGFVQRAYRSNGVVFAAMAARMALFSQARFQFQRLNGGRPGDLFGMPSLSLLERPWGPGSTTSDLLSRMLAYADAGGNAFVVRRSSSRLALPRPDWVTIVLGSNSEANVEGGDLDAEFLGIIYHPGGRNSGRKPEAITRENVAHFAPIPDPLASFRGMSWLTPIVREIMADSAATSHKLAFFENGATPNMVVSLDKDIALQAFKDWREAFEEKEPTGWNAYKTLYLGAGAKVEVVGKDLQQLDFKITQGAGETRIAAASGIHPVILGLSEGLQGSSLNAGNFQAARRLTADKALWHLWGNAAGSLEVIVPPPGATGTTRLWVDARDIPFLREDRKDAAEIQEVKARTIRQLVDAGYTADSVIAAVEAEDMGLLAHSGLFSVQLQPPNPDGPSPDIQAGRSLAALIAPHLAGLLAPPKE